MTSMRSLPPELLTVTTALIGLSPLVPIVVPLFLTATLAMVLLFPFVIGRVKEPFEPVVLLSAFFTTYVFGALDVVFGRGMRLQHTKNIYGNYDAGLNPPDAAIFLSLALLFIMLGTIAFYFGYYQNHATSKREQSSNFDKLPSPKNLEYRQKILFWTTTACVLAITLLALWQYYRFSVAVGGILEIARLMRNAGDIALSVDPSLSIVWVGTMPAVNALWYAFYVRYPRKPWALRLLYWSHFAATTYMVFSGGTRWTVIVFWLMIACIQISTPQVALWNKWRQAIVAIVGVAVVLVGMLGWRSATGGDGFTQDRLKENLASYLSGSGRYDLYDILLVGDDMGNVALLGHLIYLIPHKLPLQYGHTLVTWIEWSVPRPLWPDKPRELYTADLFVRDILGGASNWGGVPPNLIGELYLNFHLPGVLLGMYLLGMFLRRLYRWFRSEQEYAWASFIYAFLVIRFGLLLLRNDISSTIFFAIPSLVVTIAIMLSAWVLAEIIARDRSLATVASETNPGGLVANTDHPIPEKTLGCGL
jgi:oligosaccharide repeat unit polymerase